MKILVTGAAGFIGYTLCKSLLDDGFEVLGIDNINDYYDTALKYARLDILGNYDNFTFNKVDISNRSELSRSFELYKPQKVVNLAAQAGVRYSIKNPYAYMDSNLIGFLNIIELCRHNLVEGFVYASSSSVYGGNKKIPFSEKDRVDKPLALYGATKRANELIAYSYSNLYDINTTGLRFFTVYGPWGRPDMAMYIFTKNIIDGIPIPIFNQGNMKRDFTFVNDIVNGIRSAISKNYKCEVFNLGNHKSEPLMKVVSLIEQNLALKGVYDYKPMQMGDVPESFADIAYSEKKLGFKPKVNIEEGIKEFIAWYLDYHK